MQGLNFSAIIFWDEIHCAFESGNPGKYGCKSGYLKYRNAPAWSGPTAGPRRLDQVGGKGVAQGMGETGRAMPAARAYFNDFK